jgi:hypothetical protein
MLAVTLRLIGSSSTTSTLLRFRSREFIYLGFPIADAVTRPGSRGCIGHRNHRFAGRAYFYKVIGMTPLRCGDGVNAGGRSAEARAIKKRPVTTQVRSTRISICSCRGQN